MTRATLIDAMARAQVASHPGPVSGVPAEWDDLHPIVRRHWLAGTAAALPLAVDAILAPIEALHAGAEHVCGAMVWRAGDPCPTRALCDALRAEYGGAR